MLFALKGNHYCNELAFPRSGVQYGPFLLGMYRLEVSKMFVHPLLSSGLFSLRTGLVKFEKEFFVMQLGSKFATAKLIL